MGTGDETPLAGRTASRRAGYGVAASVAAFGLTLLPGPWLLRFSHDALNYGFVAVSAWCVPVSLLALGLTLSGVWRKLTTLVLAAMTALLLVPFGLIVMLASGYDAAMFRPLAELRADGRTYRLYQTNCGATCAYGLVLQREAEFLRVIKLVSPVWSAYKEDAASLRLAPDGSVQVFRGDDVLFTEVASR